MLLLLRTSPAWMSGSRDIDELVTVPRHQCRAARCAYRETVITPDPRSGEDTYDLIDDAVAALADRRGVWLGDDLASIALIASLIEQAERWLPHLVHDARANGHGWTEIARALGTNPDEARLRFDPQSPIADGRWPYDH
ncbi:hypothetical protein [Mycolicibacterium elephantis]|uniref:hypothetical protein n=1 Tax=Mycolicibacterium elephantis TaxID=81858 RepID=UPI001F2506A2|nr:hypothetical protein [Mycolicibacterium elephantis]